MEEFKIVKRVINEQLGIAEDVLELSTTFEDLGRDSLDVYQVIAVLEEELDVEIDIDKIDTSKTIEDLVNHIKELTED